MTLEKEPRRLEHDSLIAPGMRSRLFGKQSRLLVVAGLLAVGCSVDVPRNQNRVLLVPQCEETTRPTSASREGNCVLIPIAAPLPTPTPTPRVVK